MSGRMAGYIREILTTTTGMDMEYYMTIKEM